MTDKVSWKDGLIRAGMLQPAYIKEVPGLHPEVFFEFALLDPVELELRNKAMKEAAAKSSEGGINAIRETLFDTIKEWSFAASITKDSIAMLRSVLMMKLYWVVMQVDPSDEIPSKYAKPSVEDTIKK